MTIYPEYHRRVRIVDIDGTILEHVSPEHYDQVKPLPYAVDMLIHWSRQGDYIVLWTARIPELEGMTRRQLRSWGVPFNELIMGKPYSHEIHIYDDVNPIVHHVERNIGVGAAITAAMSVSSSEVPTVDEQWFQEGVEVVHGKDPTKHAAFPEKIFPDD